MVHRSGGGTPARTHRARKLDSYRPVVVPTWHGRDWKPVFRTSLKAVVLASAIFVGGALTACQPVRPGAAATVGGQRITTSQLDSVVADWRKEFARNADAGQVQQQLQQQGQQIPFDPDSPVRSALYQLVEMRVWDEVARQKGVGVTQGQIDERIARGGGGRALTA